ncbi:hypothetical protein Zmor_002805 [Zophobas morio]|uniref:Uncharacterized protein n=1 Tax=Zophobas morio TaxID=2755281 RepID=A0AA38M1G8_9CUCU|nr:hypothetical protein Zmor_002805 [Zophobas morio]
MKHLLTCTFVFIIFVCVSHAAPLDNKDTNKDSKSAFGQAFDEIVVESHLTVRRKNNGRQGRTQNVTNEETGIVKTKREIKLPQQSRQTFVQPQTPNLLASAPQKQFGASAANSQAQAFNSFGPLGSFGASATGSQTQSFGVGPNGLVGSAGFSGTQQYNFNGQTIDIAFGNAFSGVGPNKGAGAGAVITITGPDGKKRPLTG